MTFWDNLKKTLKDLGASTEKVMKNFEDADKKINEQMKKITKDLDKF